MIDAYIVIINYNNWWDTIECIDSLSKSSINNFQIVLIDNYSSNNSIKKIKQYFNKSVSHDEIFLGKHRDKDQLFFYKSYRNAWQDKEKLNLSLIADESASRINAVLKYPIIFIENDKNVGFAEGNNIGFEYILRQNNISDQDLIFMINPDTIVASNTLEILTGVDKQFFIGGCRICDYKNPDELISYGGYTINKPFGILKPIISLKKLNKIDYVYGGALVTNLKTLKKNGLLPTDYFLYWEETDWTFNAKLSGIELCLFPDAIIYDKVGGSIGRGYLANYYFIRNSYIFYKKYFKKYIPTLFLFNIIRMLNKLRKGDIQSAKAMIHGTKDYFRGKRGYTPIG